MRENAGLDASEETALGTRFFSAIIILFLAMLFTVPSVAAEGPPKLGIRPVDVAGPYYTLTMSPGESRTLTVELGNFGSTRVRARTYSADAYTLVNGGFGVRLDGEATSGTTLWLDYLAETLELDPGAGIQRTFTVKVPADARPGEYITNVVIQNADPVPGGNTDISINQVMRQALAVAITIPGPQVPGLVIGGATHRTVGGNSSVTIAVKNTGNIRLKPSGKFVLRDTVGKEVSRYPIVMDVIYAGDETVVEVPFVRRLNPGDYLASLSLSDLERGVSVSSNALALHVLDLEAETPPPTSTGPQAAPVNQEPVVAGLTLEQLKWAALASAAVILLVSLFLLRLRLQTGRTNRPGRS